MHFFGLRAPRPPETPFVGLLKNRELDDQLQAAVQKHKDVSDWVIGRSLDVVDKTEQVRLSLQTIFDRAGAPGMASAEGAWHLVSRGTDKDDHYPKV